MRKTSCMLLGLLVTVCICITSCSSGSVNNFAFLHNDKLPLNASKEEILAEDPWVPLNEYGHYQELDKTFTFLGTEFSHSEIHFSDERCERILYSIEGSSKQEDYFALKGKIADVYGDSIEEGTSFGLIGAMWICLVEKPEKLDELKKLGGSEQVQQRYIDEIRNGGRYTSSEYYEYFDVYTMLLGISNEQEMKIEIELQ